MTTGTAGAPTTPPNPVTSTVGQVVKTVTDTVEKVLPAPVAGTVHKVLGAVPLPVPAHGSTVPAQGAAPTQTTSAAKPTTTPNSKPTVTVTSNRAPSQTSKASGHPALRSGPTHSGGADSASSAAVLTSGLVSGLPAIGLPDAPAAVVVAPPVTASATRTAVAVPNPAGSDSLPGIVIVLATVAVGTVGAAHVGLFQQHAAGRARPTN